MLDKRNNVIIVRSRTSISCLNKLYYISRFQQGFTPTSPDNGQGNPQS